MEVPRLGVKSELQLPAYATAYATTMPDPSLFCDLHHSYGNIGMRPGIKLSSSWILVGFLTR